MKRHLPTFMVGVWLLIVSAGMVLLTAYQSIPGSAIPAPNQWPKESRIERAPEHPTLVLFVHPHCPCSRATLGELAMLRANCRQAVAVRVVFVQPEGTADDWAHGDLWETAAKIPGVTVQADHGGAEAHRFLANTSGGSPAV